MYQKYHPAMPASVSSSRGTSQHKKFKAACDQCHASKVKCPGGDPPCQRCADSDRPSQCHYSLAARIGKPPGSRNKKTLERIRRAEEERLGILNIGGKGNEWSVSQDIRGRSPDTGALASQNENSQDGNALDDLQVPQISSAQSTPSTLSYPSIFDLSEGASRDGASQLSSPTPDMLNDLHSRPVIHDSLSAANASGHELSDLWDLDIQNSGIVWPSIPENDFCVGVTPIDTFSSLQSMQLPSSNLSQAQVCRSTDSSQSLSSRHPGWDNRTNSMSPLLGRSPFPTLGLNKPNSLDAVVARLEEDAEDTTNVCGEPYGRKSALCQCLHKYTNVFSQLQNVEMRQYPVKADTLLTCTDLVLSTTESQLRCIECMEDSRVLVQLAMIIQTIFNWIQGQSQPPVDSYQDLKGSFGQHRLTEEESTVVKIALISRALGRLRMLLKAVVSRVERMGRSRQLRQHQTGVNTDTKHLRESVTELVRTSDKLTKWLTSRRL